MDKYLIISLQGIGDLLLATPIARNIKKSSPSSRVCVLTFTGNAGILEGNTDIDRIYTVNSARAGDLLYIMRMVSGLRKERFGASICAYPSGVRSAFLGYLSGAKVRVAQGLKMFKGYGWLFTARSTIDKVKHAVEMNLDILAVAGIDIGNADKCPKVVVGADDMKTARAFLDGNGISAGDTFVSVHPGGGVYTALYRCWPEERFASAADTLAGKPGVKIVLIGGKADAEKAARVASMMKHRPVIAAGRLTLMETSALLTMSKLLICNNSGPMHIAAALKVPTVSIFGAADPRIHRPWGEGHIVLQSGLDCSPCYYPFLRDTLKETAEKNRWSGKEFDCVTKDYRCMLKISVDDVIKASEDLLGKNDKDK